MNKGLGLLIVGILALLGGAVFAALLIKNRLVRNKDIDFDDFDTAVDEDFENFDNIEDEEIETDVEEQINKANSEIEE